MNIPTDAQYEWKAAKQYKQDAVVYYKQHRYYKFVDNKWYSWSFMFQQWTKSRNDNMWYVGEIIQGYFVKL